MVDRQEIYSLAEKIKGKYSFARNRQQFLIAIRKGKSEGTISDVEYRELNKYYENLAAQRKREALVNLESAYYEGRTYGVKREVIEAEKQREFAGYKSTYLQVKKQIKTSQADKQRQIARENLRPTTMSVSEFRKQTGTQTKKELATQQIENIKLKRALPVTTAAIPISSQIKLQTEKKIASTSDTLDPMKSSGTIQRVEKLVEREKKVEQTVGKVKSFVGIERKEGESFIKGTAKVVAGLPIDIVAQSYIIGGRVPAAIDITQAQLREGKKVSELEATRALKATPGAVAQSLDPRTPEGLVNLALTGVAVKSIGKARVQARAKPTFGTQEAVTKRITTKDFVIDETFVDVKATINKKVIEVKGRGTQAYQKIGKKQYQLKGTAELTELPTKRLTKVETRGLAQKVEGGYDVTSISKVKSPGKTKTILDVSQTAEVISEPTQVFRTMSRSVEIGKGKTLYEGRPSRVSTGVTGELYVEDIRTSTGKSVFRKNIVSESGKPVAVEQTLASNRFSVRAEQAADQFKMVSRKPDLSRTYKERQSFKPVTVQSGVQATQVKTVQLTAKPTQQTMLQQIAKQQAQSAVSKIKTSQVIKSVSTGAVTGASVQIQKQQVAYKIKTTPITKTETSISTKPITQPKTTPTIKTQPSSIIKSYPQFDYKPYIKTQPIIEQRQTVHQLQITQPDAGYISTPSTTITPPSFPASFSSPFPPTPFGGGGFYLQESSSKPTRTKTKEIKLDLPSVESVVFNIKSKAYPKFQALTGLGTRPIKI